MSGELKIAACPFCGSAAGVFQVFTNATMTKSSGWDVECKNADGCGVCTRCEKNTRNGAIEAWNRRAKAAEAVKTAQNTGSPKLLYELEQIQKEFLFGTSGAVQMGLHRLGCLIEQLRAGA